MVGVLWCDAGGESVGTGTAAGEGMDAGVAVETLRRERGLWWRGTARLREVGTGIEEQCSVTMWRINGSS